MMIKWRFDREGSCIDEYDSSISSTYIIEASENSLIDSNDKYINNELDSLPLLQVNKRWEAAVKNLDNDSEFDDHNDVEFKSRGKNRETKTIKSQKKSYMC